MFGQMPARPPQPLYSPSTMPWKSQAHKDAANAAQQPPAPAGPHYNATIAPQNIYTPQHTAVAQNQALASAAQQADPRWNMKQFSGLGRSQDAGTAAAAMPGIAQALSQGNAMAGAYQIGDTLANQQNLLAGQIGRESEGTALGNLLQRLNENQITQRNQSLSPFLQLLMGYL